MITLILIFITLIWISIAYTVALKFEAIAFKKGYGKEIHSFAMCFWLSTIGYLYVIALPDLTLRRKVIDVSENIETIKEIKPIAKTTGFFCPRCKSEISLGTSECPICHQTIDWNN